MPPPNLPDHLFRRLFDLAPMGLALCDPDGTLLAVNEAYAAIIGRTVAETIALSYWNITPRRYERQEADLLASLRKTGRYGPYEKEYIHRDGHLVPVRLTLRSIVVDKRSFIWAVVEDLSHERYRTLFREALMALTLRGMNGELIAVNKAFADLVGRTVEETLKPGRYRLLTPKIYDAKEKELLETVSRDGRYGPYNKHYHHKDGKLVPVFLNGVRLEIGDSQFIWSVVEQGILDLDAVDLGSSGFYPAPDLGEEEDETEAIRP